MKKILFLAISLFAAGAVSAQTYYYPAPPHRHVVHRKVDDFYKPKFGVTGGVSIANTVDYYNASYGTSSITAFYVGLTSTIPLAYPLSFQPEVLFSQKGYQAYSDVGGTYERRYNYIDVPLLANFRLVRGLNFLIGPQLTFPLETTTSYGNGYNSYDPYYTDGGHKSYVAGVVGLSISLSPNFDIHARYVLDLSSNYYDYNSPIPDYRNQVWQFGMGIRF